MTKMTRRHAFRVLGAPAALAATAPVATAQTPPASFTLLLVNDIYKMSDDKGKGGFARAAGIAKAERARDRAAAKLRRTKAAVAADRAALLADPDDVATLLTRLADELAEFTAS